MPAIAPIALIAHHRPRRHARCTLVHRGIVQCFFSEYVPALPACWSLSRAASNPRRAARRILLALQPAIKRTLPPATVTTRLATPPTARRSATDHAPRARRSTAPVRTALRSRYAPAPARRARSRPPTVRPRRSAPRTAGRRPPITAAAPRPPPAPAPVFPSATPVATRSTTPPDAARPRVVRRLSARRTTTELEMHSAASSSATRASSRVTAAATPEPLSLSRLTMPARTTCAR